MAGHCTAPRSGSLQHEHPGAWDGRQRWVLPCACGLSRPTVAVKWFIGCCSVMLSMATSLSAEDSMVPLQWGAEVLWHPSVVDLAAPELKKKTFDAVWGLV